MRKIITASVIFLIIGSCFTNNILTNSILVIGDTLNYNIIHSKLSASVGNNSIAIKGFNYKDQNYPQKTSVSYTVNFVNGGINGNYSINDESLQFGFSSTWYEFIIPDFVFYSSRIVYNLIDNWDYHNFSLGNYFFLSPYVKPSLDSWNFFENYKISLENDLSGFKNSGYNIDFAIELENNQDHIFFESWIGGERNLLYGKVFGFLADFESDVDFGNQLQIWFAKDSGIVSGFRMRGWINGIIDEQVVEFSLDYHYEIEDFSLPWFSQGRYRDFYPKTKLFLIAIPLSIVIIGFTIFIVRKKAQNYYSIQ